MFSAIKVVTRNHGALPKQKLCVVAAREAPVACLNAPSRVALQAPLELSAAQSLPESIGLWCGTSDEAIMYQRSEAAPVMKNQMGAASFANNL